MQLFITLVLVALTAVLDCASAKKMIQRPQPMNAAPRSMASGRSVARQNKGNEDSYFYAVDDYSGSSDRSYYSGSSYEGSSGSYSGSSGSSDYYLVSETDTEWQRRMNAPLYQSVQKPLKQRPVWEKPLYGSGPAQKQIRGAPLGPKLYVSDDNQYGPRRPVELSQERWQPAMKKYGHHVNVISLTWDFGGMSMKDVSTDEMLRLFEGLDSAQVIVFHYQQAKDTDDMMERLCKSIWGYNDRVENGPRFGPLWNSWSWCRKWPDGGDSRKQSARGYTVYGYKNSVHRGGVPLANRWVGDGNTGVMVFHRPYFREDAKNGVSPWWKPDDFKMNSQGFEWSKMTGQGVALVTIPSLKICFTSTHMYADKDTDRKAGKVVSSMADLQHKLKEKHNVECDLWIHGGNFGSRLNGATRPDENQVSKFPSMMWKGPTEHQLGLLDEICEGRQETPVNVVGGFDAPGQSRREVWDSCSLEAAAAKEYDELSFAIRQNNMGLQEFEPSSGIPDQVARFPPTFPVQQWPGQWMLTITHGESEARQLHTCYANTPMFPDRILFKNAGKGAVTPGYYHVPDTKPRSGFRHLPVAMSFQYAYDEPKKVMRDPYGDPILS